MINHLTLSRIYHITVFNPVHLLISIHTIHHIHLLTIVLVHFPIIQRYLFLNTQRLQVLVTAHFFRAVPVHTQHWFARFVLVRRVFLKGILLALLLWQLLYRVSATCVKWYWCGVLLCIELVRPLENWISSVYLLLLGLFAHWRHSTFSIRRFQNYVRLHPFLSRSLSLILLYLLLLFLHASFFWLILPLIAF